MIPGLKIEACSPLEVQPTLIREHVSPLRCGTSDGREPINLKLVFRPMASLVFDYEL